MSLRTCTLAAAAFALAACSDNTSGPDTTAPSDGRLQVVPGVLGLASVDVVVDGQTRLTNAAYGVPSATIALPLGQHRVTVVPTGAAPVQGGATVTLRERDTTRVVVVGTPTAPNPIALGDTGAAPVPGMGKLRVSHLAQNAPAIDVYRTQPDYNDFVKFMDPFPYQASSPFYTSTPGNWVIRVTTRGTSEVLAESNPIRVDALWIRTVLLLDGENGGVRIVPLGEQ